MSRNAAYVTPSLLAWARQQVRMSVPEAAKKATVLETKLTAWEEGTSKPTLRQARLLAATYRVPFAAFYLDEPPATKTHLPKDFRRSAGSLLDGLSPLLLLDLREAWQRREIALELLQAQGAHPPTFAYSTDLKTDPEEAATDLRTSLNVSLDEQIAWRDARKAFNSWRAHAESSGVMVLQTSDIPLEALRAYSLYAQTLPVVVVNRKDVLVGRLFSLLHELVHLGLHSEGLCDLSTDVTRAPEDQRLEVFCNAVAAAALVPKHALLSHPVVRLHAASPKWPNQDIEALARHFSTSREALLRRLLTLGLTDDAFYRHKREEYRLEYASRPATKGFVTPPVDALSLLGKPFVRLVLDGLDGGTVTTSDAADYLGLRLKHLPTLAASLESEGA